MGVPCIVDRSGVRGILDLKLDDQELAQFLASTDKLKEQIANLI